MTTVAQVIADLIGEIPTGYHPTCGAVRRAMGWLAENTDGESELPA